MTAVGGGVNQHVSGAFSQTPLKDRLQIFILQLIVLEGQVVHVDDELVVPVLDLLQHVGERLKLVLIYLNDTQPLVIIFIQDRLDAAGLPGSRVPVEQHVVGLFSADKRLGVLDQLFLLQLIAHDVVQVHMLHIDDGVDDHLLAVFLLHHPKRLVEAEFTHAELPVEIHHQPLESVHVRRLLQLDRQIYDAVADALVKYLAVRPGRFVGR